MAEPWPLLFTCQSEADTTFDAKIPQNFKKISTTAENFGLWPQKVKHPAEAALTPHEGWDGRRMASFANVLLLDPSSPQVWLSMFAWKCVQTCRWLKTGRTWWFLFQRSMPKVWCCWNWSHGFPPPFMEANKERRGWEPPPLSSPEVFIHAWLWFFYFNVITVSETPECHTAEEWRVLGVAWQPKLFCPDWTATVFTGEAPSVDGEPNVSLMRQEKCSIWEPSQRLWKNNIIYQVLI